MRQVLAFTITCLAGVTVHLKAEPVTWTGAVGVTLSGNSLTRGSATAAWNAGAASVQVIRDGDGFVEFTASETSTYRMCGLSRGDTNQADTDIDFALYLLNTGGVQVRESGTSRGTFGTYVAGDRMRVEIAYGVVRYLRNGTLLYPSGTAPSFPLRVDASLYTPGATLSDVRVGNLIWSGATGVSVVDRTLTATVERLAPRAGKLDRARDRGPVVGIFPVTDRAPLSLPSRTPSQSAQKPCQLRGLRGRMFVDHQRGRE